MKWHRIDESTPKVIMGAGTIQCDDDLVRVYNPDGECVYFGIWDDCPYKDEETTYSSLTKTYKCVSPFDEDDYRIIALVEGA